MPLSHQRLKIHTKNMFLDTKYNKKLGNLLEKCPKFSKTAMRISRDFHLYLNKTKFCPDGCSIVKFIKQKSTNDFIYMSSKIEKKIEIKFCDN